MKDKKLNGPTYLTILRMILSIIFLIFVLLPEAWSKIIALSLFILSAITDSVDGRWARRDKLVTDLGAFLDPLADKMLVNLAFLALVYLSIVPIWVFAIILVRDFAVDGMRMMAARSGRTVSASIYGKLKTTTQMMALSILIFNLIVNNEIMAIIGSVTLYLALGLTVFSGLDYIIRGWKQLTK